MSNQHSVTGGRIHSVQWEVLMVGRLFKFYRRHADPSAKHLFWLTVSYLLHLPHTLCKALLPPTNSRYQFTARRDGQLGWLEHMCTYINCSESLHDQIQRLEWEFNPGRRAQDPTWYQFTICAIHYRPYLKSQKTAWSAVGVKRTTFRTAASNEDRLAPLPK